METGDHLLAHSCHLPNIKDLFAETNWHRRFQSVFQPGVRRVYFVGSECPLRGAVCQ